MNKGLNQLPSIVEDLAKTLQSVKDFLNSSNIGDIANRSNQEGASRNEGGESVDASNLSSTLQSLSSMLSVASSSNHNKESVQNKSNQNLKRQQSAPTYNPTPINELKKIKEVVSDSNKHKLDEKSSNQNEDLSEDSDDLIETKRRKMSSKSSSEVPNTKSKHLSDSEDSENFENQIETEIKEDLKSKV